MIKIYVSVLIIMLLVCFSIFFVTRDSSSNVITKTECIKVLERVMCVDTIIKISEPYFIDEK